MKFLHDIFLVLKFPLMVPGLIGHPGVVVTPSVKIHG